MDSLGPDNLVVEGYLTLPICSAFDPYQHYSSASLVVIIPTLQCVCLGNIRERPACCCCRGDELNIHSDTLLWPRVVCS